MKAEKQALFTLKQLCRLHTMCLILFTHDCMLHFCSASSAEWTKPTAANFSDAPLLRKVISKGHRLFSGSSSKTSKDNSTGSFPAVSRLLLCSK